MLFEKQHLRHCLLFAFQLKKNAVEAKEMICSILGEKAVSYSTCKKWFQQFREENFNLQNDQPKRVEDEELEQILDERAKLNWNLQRHLECHTNSFHLTYRSWGGFAKSSGGSLMSSLSRTKVDATILLSSCSPSSRNRI